MKKKLILLLLFISIFSFTKINIVKASQDENDALWKGFVEKYQQAKIFQMLLSVETNEINLESSNDSLKISIKDNNLNETIVINFTYNNGILSLVPSKEAKNSLIEELLSSNSISALADMKGYNSEKLNAWMESKEETDFTLEKDGIEMETIKKTFQNEHSTVTTEIIIKFELDIKNGLKSFANSETNNNDKKNQDVEIKEDTSKEEIKEDTSKEEIKEDTSKEENVLENPQTGHNVMIFLAIIVLILTCGIISYVGLQKNNNF